MKKSTYQGIVEMIIETILEQSNFSRADMAVMIPLFKRGLISLKIKMTPELAEALLKLNDTADRPNRKTSSVWIKRYANMMENGVWKFNGDTIVLSDKLSLLDGQHRCFAYLKACEKFGEDKINFEVLILLGVDENTFITIDAGKSRTVSDDNSIAGQPAGDTYYWYQHKIDAYIKGKWGRNHKLTRNAGDILRDTREPDMENSFNWVKDKVEQYKLTMRTIDQRLASTKIDIFAAFHYISTFTDQQKKVEDFIDKFFNPNYQQAQCPVSVAKSTWRRAIDDTRSQNRSGNIIKLLTHSLNLFLIEERAFPEQFDRLLEKNNKDIIIPFGRFGYLVERRHNIV